MNKIILLSTLSLTTLFVRGQDFQKRFKALQDRNDTTAQEQLLLNWEKSNPKDPELFVAYFNYYAGKSAKELISFDPNKKSDQSFAVTDTGTGKPVAYMNSIVRYDPVILHKGFDYIDRGIALNPARLDMRFGKIYMLGQTANFEEFTKTIVATIDYANNTNYAWTWKDGKPLDDGKEFFLGSMQDYIKTIYETEDDNLLPYMRQISEAVLKYNPNHVESLANVALTYLITQNYDKALEYLLKAEKIAPTDVVVLNNIAQAYARKEDKTNAKLYLQKVIKVGNKEEVEIAKEQLKELNQ